MEDSWVKYDDKNTPYVMWGDNKIEMETYPITEDFYKKKAEQELRETPEIVQQGLKELRELLKHEKLLNVPIDNDDFLIGFLRPCKFYSQSAFNKMKAYYNFRLSHPKYCADLYPSATGAFFKHSVISILMPRDQHGRRIMLIECGERWDPHELSLKKFFRAAQTLLEAGLLEPRTQIAGIVLIVDFAGLSMKQIVHFSPSFAGMVLNWLQDCIPFRIKALHIINQPVVFDVLFAVFKPFLREKLRTRVHFHGSDMSSLSTHIHAKSLRSRHGGDLPDPEIPGAVFSKMLEHYEDEIKLGYSHGYPPKTKK